MRNLENLKKQNLVQERRKSTIQKAAKISISKSLGKRCKSTRILADHSWVEDSSIRNIH